MNMRHQGWRPSSALLFLIRNLERWCSDPQYNGFLTGNLLLTVWFFFYFLCRLSSSTCMITLVLMQALVWLPIL
jgi:hypothetical protein